VQQEECQVLVEAQVVQLLEDLELEVQQVRVVRVQPEAQHMLVGSLHRQQTLQVITYKLLQIILREQ
jgi:hypothetical protein